MRESQVRTKYRTTYFGRTGGSSGKLNKIGYIMVRATLVRYEKILFSTDVRALCAVHRVKVV
jgi:hypothetical protein